VYEARVCLVLWGVFVVCRRCFELAMLIFESSAHVSGAHKQAH
jgi:hypothetical protein